MTGSRFWITQASTPNARRMIIVLPRRSRTCNSTPRTLSLPVVRPPQAACNFPTPFHRSAPCLPARQISHPRCPSHWQSHRPTPYLQAHQISHPRCHSRWQLRILMFRPPIDPPCLKRSTPPLGPRFCACPLEFLDERRRTGVLLAVSFSLSLTYIFLF